MTSMPASAARSLRDTGVPLLDAWRTTRAHTEALAASLSAEDQCIQSMPDASPAKWHRAHTSWFFEQFLLIPHDPDYRPFDPRFGFLFNSYYEAVGARHPRPSRGLLTRPSAEEVSAYRAHVDEAMERFLPRASAEALSLIELGLQHEQQHQELLLTDMLHGFAQSPLLPAVIPGWQEPPSASGAMRFIERPGGILRIGHRGAGFHFDNEGPCHQLLLQPHALASHLVRNTAFCAFIADGGYTTPSLWMSEGFDMARSEGWTAPLYWQGSAQEGFAQMTPGCLVPLDPAAPVRHISWFEADAFARWSGARLPLEAELEASHTLLCEFATHVWQWTGSAYLPYPGFKPATGAVGEYNGKFMINQMVLRGGSAATPPGHARPTYRNFFHPGKRWQFTGLRLARDL
jgi:ergothioneine biosynthesis protein EgtB